MKPKVYADGCGITVDNADIETIDVIRVKVSHSQ